MENVKNFMLQFAFKIVILVFFIISGSIVEIFSQDTLKNLPEFSLPLTSKKMVIAHCMPNIISFKFHKLEDSCDPAYYSYKDNASADLGGLTQVLPLTDKYYKDSTIDQAIAFDLKAAKLSGIDGFQFYFTIGNQSWDEIIKAYFRVANALNLDFKFTFCFSHPWGGTEAGKISEWSTRINNIIKVVPHDDTHWLRTPDGRLIVYMWYGEGLNDVPVDLAGFPIEFYTARAYKKLASAVKENFACMYSINENMTAARINSILDYFPTAWVWTMGYSKYYVGKTLAAECKKRNRFYTGSAFNDFYTSKLLKPGTWDMFYQVSDAVNAGIANVERKYMVTGLSYNFRKSLEFAIEQDAPIINIITWNDYPEGHHMAPEINHNYGFSVLLNYYKSVWKNETSPYDNRDVAIAFFKKYRHDYVPDPYKIKLVNLDATFNPKNDDSIDVVTILKEPAQLKVNGEIVNVLAGIQSTKFVMKPGAVKVAVIRNSIETKNFTSPEWITRVPYRTDMMTYTYDTEYQNFHKDLFGNRAPQLSLEYNSDSTEQVNIDTFSVVQNLNRPFSIFPNPLNSDRLLTIELQNNNEISHLELIDQLGRIQTIQYKSLTNSVIVNCSAVKPGIYILKGVLNNQLISSKLVLN